MPEYLTLTEAVCANAAAHPGQAACVYLHEAGRSMLPQELSYAQLDRRARSVAVRLREQGGDPDRPVLLLYPPTLDLVTAFLGCLYAGRPCVPALLPDEPDDRPAQVARLVRDASPGTVLTQYLHRESIATWVRGAGKENAGKEHVVCAATDGPEADEADPAAWRPVPWRPDELAFIQYTSGSTGRPKGVPVTHGNLMAAQEAIRRSIGSRPGVRTGSWLPAHHGMGLVGMVLHPLWMGGTAVLMSPRAFANQPHRWLRMIHDHGIEVTAAPGFGYELCLRRITEEQSAGLDLSCLAAALCCGEPVRSGTLRAFAERFAPAGLRPRALQPCYGLAEAVPLVSGGERDRPPAELLADIRDLEQDVVVPARAGRTGTPLVSSGRPRPEELLIVDPVTRKVLDDGQVGEIWLHGPGVAPGYWRRPALTREAFGASTADGRTGWLRTGDLGALRKGELFVLGRLGERITHQGRSLYPQEIERAVQDADPAFRPGGGAVFAVHQRSGQARIVVVQEVRPGACADGGAAALARTVHTVLRRGFRVPGGSVLLVPPGVVRRTAGGTIRRALMRRLFLEGTLPAVHASLEPQVAALLPEGRGYSRQNAPGSASSLPASRRAVATAPAR